MTPCSCRETVRRGAALSYGHTACPVVGPEAYPSGYPQPLMTCALSHPHNTKIAPHVGAGRGLHSPGARQLPIGYTHSSPAPQSEIAAQVVAPPDDAEHAAPGTPSNKTHKTVLIAPFAPGRSS